MNKQNLLGSYRKAEGKSSELATWMGINTTTEKGFAQMHKNGGNCESSPSKQVILLAGN